jgi:molecular chaperone GrpE
MSTQDDFLASLMREATRIPISAANSDELRPFLLRFLTVLDALDRLLSSAEKSSAPPENTLVEQLRIMRKQFRRAFEDSGVAFFECTGQPFDPALHKAVEIVQRPDLANNTIAEELARGCYWHGQVLRYAQVVVVQNEEL